MNKDKNNASTYMRDNLCVLLVAHHIQGGVLQGCVGQAFCPCATQIRNLHGHDGRGDKSD